MTARPARSTGAPQRLAAEHDLLLRAVIARADEVLAALSSGRWPTHELAELIRYLQSEVIRQTRMEEEFLFARAGSSSDAEVSRLARDHVKIRYTLEALTDEARARDHGDPRRLSRKVRTLVVHLDRHLRQERAILSRHATEIGWQRALVAMQSEPHATYPLVHAAVIDVDELSISQAVAAVWPRVRRLPPDEQIILASGSDLRFLCMLLLRDEDLAVRYLDDGPQTWRASVTRRRLQ
jgi:hemerythrin-like domain-containing protein